MIGVGDLGVDIVNLSNSMKLCLTVSTSVELEGALYDSVDPG